MGAIQTSVKSLMVAYGILFSVVAVAGRDDGVPAQSPVTSSPSSPSAATGSKNSEDKCDVDESPDHQHPNASIVSLTQALVKFPALATLLESDLKDYTEDAASCVSRAKIAMYSCATCLSKYIQNGVNIAQTALSGLSGMSAATGQCSGLENAAKMLQGVLGAYQVACGGTKALCDSACSSASKAVVKLEKKIPGVSAKLNAAASCTPTSLAALNTSFGSAFGTCEELIGAKGAVDKLLSEAKVFAGKETDASSAGTLAKKTKMCDGYTMTLASAAAGIGSFIVLNKQAESCKKATEVATQNICAPLPGKTIIETTLDKTCLATLCGKTEYSSRTECVCYNAPRTQGCSNGLMAAGTESGGALQATAVDPNSASLQSSGSATLAVNSDSPSGTVMTRSTVGSDGLKSTTNSTAASAPSTLGKTTTALNQETAPTSVQRSATSLYGGESSGSGGYGGSSSSYGSGSSGLRSYLPGGSKDPTRSAASTALEGVSSSAGKSNFEKISDRYTENRSSLNATGK